MKGQYLDTLAFVWVVLGLAIVGILFFNTENIQLLSIGKQTIQSQNDYSLDFPQGDLVDITLTPSSIFKTEDIVNGITYSMFSTDEYVFDFLIISDKYPKGKTTFNCRDVSQTKRNLLDKLVEEFNQPVDIASVLQKEGIFLSAESQDSLYQSTAGKFGSSTRLLDCTDSVVRSKPEVYFIIGLEIIVVVSSILLIFRRRIGEAFEEIAEDN